MQYRNKIVEDEMFKYQLPLVGGPVSARSQTNKTTQNCFLSVEVYIHTRDQTSHCTKKNSNYPQCGGIYFTTHWGDNSTRNHRTTQTAMGRQLNPQSQNNTNGHGETTRPAITTQSQHTFHCLSLIKCMTFLNVSLQLVDPALE